MKCVVSIFFLSALVVAFAAEKYTTKYDNIDLDVVLNNERLYKKYFQCLTNAGRCPPDGKELKASLPDALATNCAKCSKKQKEGSEKVINFIVEKKPKDFEKLEELYDPDGVYRKKNPKVKKHSKKEN
ncbi:ejaculatory bulb-specific protein 3-like [Cimex lectularius]|uniref:Chemosensory protein n=1 Tax=Cimex lectularius TaxID=79782 RepID=A0A8I6TFU8_CIMLE|nr:ejaculatory bulb-specific protein 3-like [Cimex lectularius]